MIVTQPLQKTLTAEFTARWGPSAAVITVHGELDAANADDLADYVRRCMKYSSWLILDLHGLEFIGTAGFSALHRINVVCSAAGAQWAIVPSHAVLRLLRICDPDGVLPAADSMKEALRDAQSDEPPRLLQLVAQSR